MQRCSRLVLSVQYGLTLFVVYYQRESQTRTSGYPQPLCIKICHFFRCLIVGLSSSKKLLLLLHHRSVSNSVSTMYNKKNKEQGMKERQKMYQSLQVYQLYTYSLVTCECPSSRQKCKKNSPCFMPHWVQCPTLAHFLLGIQNSRHCFLWDEHDSTQHSQHIQCEFGDFLQHVSAVASSQS